MWRAEFANLGWKKQTNEKYFGKPKRSKQFSISISIA